MKKRVTPSMTKSTAYFKLASSERCLPRLLSNPVLMKKKMGSGESALTLPTSMKLAQRTLIPFVDRPTSRGDGGLQAP